MEVSEQTVWIQHALHSEEDWPAASHVSAILSAFPTIFQRGVERRDDVGLVFRLATSRSQWMAAVGTSVKPIQLNVPLPNVPTNIGGVSAAERLVLTPERIPDVLGKVVVVYEHGNFSDKDQVSWGHEVRQDLQPPHTQLLKQDDLDFEAFIERDGPVPTRHVGKFWERKWKELLNERQEWAEAYTESDSLRTRYWRIKKYKRQMRLSS